MIQSLPVKQCAFILIKIYISPSLAFVQFPQRFHNISNNDIYGAALRPTFEVRIYIFNIFEMRMHVLPAWTLLLGTIIIFCLEEVTIY